MDLLSMMTTVTNKNYLTLFLVITCVTGNVLDNNLSENCVLSLTIPKESIKSSCNVNEAIQRKLQSVEGQSVQMRNKIQALNMRLPQIVTQQSHYNGIVNRLDLTVAQVGTYFKRLEERVQDLEVRKTKETSDQANSKSRINSPDTLLDPIRPLLMAELEAFKETLMMSIVNSIVPKLLDPSDALGSNFKQTIIDSLRQQILPAILEPKVKARSANHRNSDMLGSQDSMTTTTYTTTSVSQEKTTSSDNYQGSNKTTTSNLNNDQKKSETFTATSMSYQENDESTTPLRLKIDKKNGEIITKSSNTNHKSSESTTEPNNYQESSEITTEPNNYHNSSESTTESNNYQENNEATTTSSTIDSSDETTTTKSNNNNNNKFGSLARSVKNISSENYSANNFKGSKTQHDSSEESTEENELEDNEKMSDVVNGNTINNVSDVFVSVDLDNDNITLDATNTNATNASNGEVIVEREEIDTAPPQFNMGEYMKITQELVVEEAQKLTKAYQQGISNVRIEFMEALNNMSQELSLIGAREANNRDIVNQTMIEMKEKLALLDRKVEKPLNDFTVNNIIERRISMEGTNIQKTLTNRMTVLVNTLKDKMEQQNRKINMSTSLVNIFKQTLVNFQDESKRTIKSMESKITEIQGRIEDKNKANNINEETKERLRYLEEEIQAVADSQLFTEQDVDLFKRRATENDREAQNKIRQLINKVNNLQYQVSQVERLKASVGLHDNKLNETSKQIATALKGLEEIQKRYEMAQLEENTKYRFVEYIFQDNAAHNSCTGKKYIKRNNVGNGVPKFVGVQLCSSKRYKIFLGESLTGMFLDIGDTLGHGQDHCQFVGAIDPKGNYITDRKFVILNGMSAYLRKGWNDIPKLGKLSLMRPTPSWYECGVTIPE